MIKQDSLKIVSSDNRVIEEKRSQFLNHIFCTKISYLRSVCNIAPVEMKTLFIVCSVLVLLIDLVSSSKFTVVIAGCNDGIDRHTKSQDRTNFNNFAD